MYLDLGDYRPDTPRLTSAISPREGVLLSLLAHAVAIIVYLLAPERAAVTAAAMPPPPPEETVTFVHMQPRVEIKAQPKLQAEHSDLDRRAASPEKSLKPENAMPVSRGNTPEKMVGAPAEKPAGPVAPPAPPAPPATPPSTSIPDSMSRAATEIPASVARPPGGGLGNQLRNLQQFLQDQNFENSQGQSDPNAPDVQFDSKGVEFGPWLRRFVAQVKRNWYVPQAAMLLRGRVVIQFYVHRDGRITDLKIVQECAVPSFNIAAFNSLKLSNPTLALPPEYPDDKAFFTVTFHYNDGPGR